MSDQISFEDWKKLDIKVGKVTEKKVVYRLLQVLFHTIRKTSLSEKAS